MGAAVVTRPVDPAHSSALAALSVTKVEVAFTTAGGFHRSLTVKNTTSVIHVEGNAWIHDTVVIPASVCAEI